MYGVVTSHSVAPERSSSMKSLPRHHHHPVRESQPQQARHGGGDQLLQASDPSQSHTSNYSRRPSSKSRSIYKRMVNLFKKAWTGVKQDDNDTYIVSCDDWNRQKPRGIQSLCRCTKFTREELQLLYRGFKQACPTGKVTEDALRDIYAKFFPHGDTTRYAHYVFNSFDNDQSGEITFEEFAMSLSALLRGSMHDKIGWTFNLYDIDHDGCITKGEMLNIVSSIYSLLGNKGIEPKVDDDTARLHVEKVFQKLDLNKDGVVTLEEFIEVCTKDEAIRRAMCMFDTI